MSSTAPRAPAGERENRRAALAAAAVALVVLLAWWPISPYWQSDDFLAVTYASDLQRALADFKGNQYGSTALVWFYRPLITLSFALDVWLGGADPWVAHMSPVLAHAVSTLLLTLIGRRLLGDGSGVCLGLLWGLWPSHAGSIAWAVGRVDSHTTVWILLACWSTLRWLDGRRGRGLALVAFALALLSKELAFVTPGLVALLGFATAARGDRLRQAWRAAWPFLALFAVYLGWRFAVLGRLIGGYEDAHFSFAASFAGLGAWTGRLVNPLLAIGDLPLGLRLLGFAAWPIAIACAIARRRVATLLLLALGFALCALPTAPFWAETVEGKNLRYFYLPAACLLGIVALGGRWPSLLALACAAPALVQVRQHYHAAHTRAATVHAAVRAADAALPVGPLFVRGLPRENAAHDVLMFHLFVDRLTAPPFGSGRRLFAHRPLVERPGVLTVPDDVCAGIAGVHVRVLDDDGNASQPRPSPLPELMVEADDLHLTPLTFWDLHRGRTTRELRFPGSSAPCYRLTLFTAGGYLTCVVAPDAGPGRVSIAALLTRSPYASQGDDAFLALALNVPTAFDLVTDFPLLAEAGTVTGDDPHTFVPTARAARLVPVTFDRTYSEWLAGRIDDPRR